MQQLRFAHAVKQNRSNRTCENVSLKLLQVKNEKVTFNIPLTGGTKHTESLCVAKLWQQWLNFMTLCDHNDSGIQNHSIGIEENGRYGGRTKEIYFPFLCCYSTLWSFFLFFTWPPLPVTRIVLVLYSPSPFLFIILHLHHFV